MRVKDGACKGREDAEVAQIGSCNLDVGMLSSSRFSCKLRVLSGPCNAVDIVLCEVGFSKRVAKPVKEDGL